MRTVLAPLVSLVTLALFARPAAEDLAKRYPGKLGWVEQGLAWECGAEDVWALKSFALTFGKDFALECRPADVALGVHAGNVLWAVVFPAEAGKLRARGQPGDGAAVRALHLRFAPGEIGRVFPSKTVKGPGDAWRRFEAQRIFRHGLGYDWFTPAGNPTVVQPGFTLVDVYTPKGERGCRATRARARRTRAGTGASSCSTAGATTRGTTSSGRARRTGSATSTCTR